MTVSGRIDRRNHLRIRAATADDANRLAPFYALAYAGKERWKFPERWRWEYVDNPFKPADLVPLWIIEDDERVVGQTGAMYVPCRVGGRTVRAAWSVDTYVLREYRGLGLGRGLQEANQQAHELFISLGMTSANRAIKQKIGGRELHGMSVYARVNRVEAETVLGVLERAAARRMNRPAVRALRFGAQWSLAGRVAGFWMTRRFRRALREAQQRDAGGAELIFKEAEGRFDADADRLWERARERFDFAVERTSAYLNWKYRDQPWVSYRAAFAVRALEVVGLVIFRMGHPPEPPVGLIAELIVAEGSPGVDRALADFAAGLLEKSGAHAVLAGSSEAGQESALRQAGFIKHAEYTPVAGGDPDLVSRISEATTMMLSLGDHDLDQFPYLKLPSPLRLWREMS